MASVKAQLTGADVRAERARHSVTQEDLAKELDWYQAVLIHVENGRIEASQAQYQAMLDAITRIVAARAGR